MLYNLDLKYLYYLGIDPHELQNTFGKEELDPPPRLLHSVSHSTGEGWIVRSPPSLSRVRDVATNIPL
jgi:hypothetical protein